MATEDCVASMVASMASMILLAPRATMVLASAALKAPVAGVSAFEKEWPGGPAGKAMELQQWSDNGRL